jgi:ABC-type transport system involved in multi-copper enzyme maturation permease subunit
MLSDWESVQERAPSVMRADRPLAARVIAMVGLMLTTVGAFALIFWAIGRPYLVGPTLAFFFLALGVGGLLFHAFSEKELNYRRAYAALGTALILGAVLAMLVTAGEEFGRLFLPISTPFLFLGLMFLVSFARNETEVGVRTVTVRLLGLAGLLMILVALLLSNVGSEFERFLLTRGNVLFFLGFLYVAAFIAMQDAGSDLGYWAGALLGGVGAVLVLLAVIRPIVSERFTVMPDGLLFILWGVMYLLLAAGVCLDWPLVVLTRRELAAFFYSPIAYIILFALTVLGWFLFLMFVNRIAVSSSGMDRPMLEPIVASYIGQWIPVICVIFMVPVLTMRLFSEELRTGTLEVLLTAPVKEWHVVLSKFIGAFLFYLLAWLPWGLYLIALRAEGGREFDVRPLLTFFIVLAVTGSGFLSMGVFFSSVTRNQVAAAILAFMGMVLLLGVFFLSATLNLGPTWRTVLNYISFIDLWVMAIYGNLAPRFLLFYLSACVFFLFLTVKVLDARKWA